MTAKRKSGNWIGCQGQLRLDFAVSPRVMMLRECWEKRGQRDAARKDINNGITLPVSAGQAHPAILTFSNLILIVEKMRKINSISRIISVPNVARRIKRTFIFQKKTPRPPILQGNCDCGCFEGGKLACRVLIVTTSSGWLVMTKTTKG